MSTNMNSNDEKKGLLSTAKKHKIVTIIVIALLAVAVYRIVDFGLGLSDTVVITEKPISVKTAIIGYENISQAAPLSGRISPAEEAAITPMVPGKVTRVNVKVGDYVMAGAVLFEVDKSTAAPQYNQLKAALDMAKNTFDNMEILYAEGAISKVEYDNARMNYITTQENFNLAAEQLSYCDVKTPIDGYVTSMNATVGNMVGNGMAASVANTEVLEIKANMADTLAGLVNIGDTVDVTVQNIQDEVFKGTVTALSPAPALGTYTYPITITLDNSSERLMSGMFAEVELISAESENALCVPSDAVIVKNGRTVVVLLENENVPVFKEVTTGIDNGVKVEILSGVSEGDVIVISGQNFVTEGAPVNVL